MPCARPIEFGWTQRFNLSYKNCFLGLTLGFWKKNFREINLFFRHVFFITLAQKTTMRLQTVRFLETFRRALSWIKTEVLFLYMFRIELLFIFSFITCHSRTLQCVEFKNFCSFLQCAVCCSFSVTCALNNAWIKFTAFVFSYLFTALYSHWKSELI